jgi:hypothetical protein
MKYNPWIPGNVLLLLGAGDLLIATVCVFCGPLSATWGIASLLAAAGVLAIAANYGMRLMSRP